MEQKEAKIFEYKTQILEQHLDTFGHVNNANYLTLYEQARWQFITDNGLSHDEIMRTQKGPVILEVKIKYKKELKNREWITIVSQAKNLRSRFVTICQSMLKADGTVASEAEFLVGFFDMKERKLISGAETWLHAIGY